MSLHMKNEIIFGPEFGETTVSLVSMGTTAMKPFPIPQSEILHRCNIMAEKWILGRK